MGNGYLDYDLDAHYEYDTLTDPGFWIQRQRTTGVLMFYGQREICCLKFSIVWMLNASSVKLLQSMVVPGKKEFV